MSIDECTPGYGMGKRADPQPQLGTCAYRYHNVPKGHLHYYIEAFCEDWKPAAPQARPAPPEQTWPCTNCGESHRQFEKCFGRVAGEAQGEATFSDDDIRRNDIPKDAFGLIHDLCYDHEGRDRWQYMTRAQDILRVDAGAHPAQYGTLLLAAHKWLDEYVTRDGHYFFNVGERRGVSLAGLLVEFLSKAGAHPAPEPELHADDCRFVKMRSLRRQGEEISEERLCNCGKMARARAAPGAPEEQKK